MTPNTTVQFASIEAALSALSQRVLGCDIEIVTLSENNTSKLDTLTLIDQITELQRDLATVQSGNRSLSAALDTERELRKAAEQNILNLLHYAEGYEGDLPVSGNAVAVRDAIVELRDLLHLKDTSIRVANQTNTDLLRQAARLARRDA